MGRVNSNVGGREAVNCKRGLGWAFNDSHHGGVGVGQCLGGQAQEGGSNRDNRGTAVRLVRVLDNCLRCLRRNLGYAFLHWRDWNARQCLSGGQSD